MEDLGNSLELLLESDSSASSPQDLQSIVANLSQLADLDLSALMSLQRGTIRPQLKTVEVHRAIADAILRLGEPLIAYDVLSEGLKTWPQDLQLRQLMALALARSGATISANALLQQLVDEGQRDEETLGLLARTHKDLWSQASDRQTQAHHLALAADYYGQAYRLRHSYWTGINAATMAFLQGHCQQAQGLARLIRQQCLDALAGASATEDPYWILATLGEVALILGSFAEAEDYYGQAIAVAQGRFGDLSSSCRNASMLLHYQGGDLSLIRRWFQIPRVSVFCGHMIDTPDRAQPRFPLHLEDRVYQAIRDRLEQNDIHFGYASAACGADILFLEALLELKGEIHIVLPYDKQQFIQDSVDILPHDHLSHDHLPRDQWRQRFDQVMAKATEVIVASQHKAPRVDEAIYEYSYRMLHGLAKIRASQLDTELVPLAVWNGLPGDGGGGTGSAIHYWQQWSEKVEIIDLDALLKRDQAHLGNIDCAPVTPQQSTRTPLVQSVASAIPPADLEFRPKIRAMLFADVVNFSHLREEQFPAFVHHFLGTVAQLSQSSDYSPLFQNTWGDALYFVFETVQKAGVFALQLCDLIEQIDWQTKGLPPNLNVRIALHAGPVMRHRDPITGHENYIGAHVNHTARIEPITPPGKVYTSQAFAALVSSEGVTDFACDYVGKTPYAKQYGTFPTYHVRRHRA